MTNNEVIARGGGNYSVRKYFEMIEQEREESLKDDMDCDSTNLQKQNERNLAGNDCREDNRSRYNSERSNSSLQKL